MNKIFKNSKMNKLVIFASIMSLSCANATMPDMKNDKKRMQWARSLGLAPTATWDDIQRRRETKELGLPLTHNGMV